MPKNKYFNLSKLVDEDLLHLETDEDGNVIPYSIKITYGPDKGNRASSHDTMWVLYGQINSDGNLNGIGRSFRVDH